VNHIYVYPTFVNLGSYKGPSSARNIACFVYLLDTDKLAQTPTELNCESLKAMYGRGGMTTMVNHEVTSVTYHQHKPHFFEEIKILLPNRMSTLFFVCVCVCVCFWMWVDLGGMCVGCACVFCEFSPLK
jgi:C2 domain in Dock180 and Zizimin proteins